MKISTNRTVTALVATAATAGLVFGAVGCSEASDAADSATSAAGSAANDASGAVKSAMPGGSGTSGAESGAPGAPSGEAPGGAPGAPAVASTSIDSPSGTSVSINDPGILEAYAGRGYEKGYLGKPLGPVVTLPTGGKYITFEHGSLYLNPKTKKAYAVHGAIGGYWGSLNHERGELGYPTGDETKADGGLEQSFDGGTLLFKDGKVTKK